MTHGLITLVQSDKRRIRLAILRRRSIQFLDSILQFLASTLSFRTFPDIETAVFTTHWTAFRCDFLIVKALNEVEFWMIGRYIR